MPTTHPGRLVATVCVSCWLASGAAALAQSTSTQKPSDKPQTLSRVTSPAPATSAPSTAPARAVVPPPGYVIGPDDVLAIVYWREKDLSAEVVVRPDGVITLPLIEDIRVAGMTPAELKQKIQAEAGKLVTSPNVSVVVKQINSRKVFITGHVAKPGSYNLSAPMTVVQLIALSGGLLEYADRSKIRVMRVEKGAPETHLVNYKQLSKGEDLNQNIILKPGDTVIVP
jgi:polysaccharide export outer membrane protein